MSNVASLDSATLQPCTKEWFTGWTALTKREQLRMRHPVMKIEQSVRKKTPFSDRQCLNVQFKTVTLLGCEKIHADVRSE
jgi:hypothetical protein